jgi:hypothetical protein
VVLRSAHGEYYKLVLLACLYFHRLGYPGERWQQIGFEWGQTAHGVRSVPEVYVGQATTQHHTMQSNSTGHLRKIAMATVLVPRKKLTTILQCIHFSSQTAANTHFTHLVRYNSSLSHISYISFCFAAALGLSSHTYIIYMGHIDDPRPNMSRCGTHVYCHA